MLQPIKNKKIKITGVSCGHCQLLFVDSMQTLVAPPRIIHPFSIVLSPISWRLSTLTLRRRRAKRNVVYIYSQHVEKSGLTPQRPIGSAQNLPTTKL